MVTGSRTPLSADSAKRYYRQDYANAVPQYYAQGEILNGWWHGKLAAHFGLDGAVHADQFSRLADGQDPLTGEVLIRSGGRRQHAREHRAGWDFVISAPKPVSLLALVAGDRNVYDAHVTSAKIALDALEQYVTARHVRSATANYCIAAFTHDTARPAKGIIAPQLHTHAVVFNMTKADKIRSIDPRELYRSQEYATAVYRAQLAVALKALGYTVTHGAKNEIEIVGFSDEYLRAASPRRQDIQAAMQATQRTGAGAAQVAAYQTRAPKTTRSKEEIQQQHQEMAAAYGFQPQRVASLAAATDPIARTPEMIHTAIAYAKERCFEQEAVVMERTLLTAILQRGLGHVTLADAQPVFWDYTRRGDFEQRRARDFDLSRCWTTPEMVTLERDTMRRMLVGRGTMTPIRQIVVPSRHYRTARRIEEHAQNARTRYAALTPDQRTALDTILHSRDQVMALVGIAGAGKTTTLEALQYAVRSGGYVVTGLAPTSRAAQNLAGTGIRTHTADSYLHRPWVPKKPHYLILDESSLASTMMMKAVLDRLRPQDRILLVGDIAQHQSVGPGKSFQQLLDAGMQAARLTQIVRQTDPDQQRIVQHLATGRVQEALDALNAHGHIHIVADRASRMAWVAHRVVHDPASHLVVCPDNESRRELNTAIRDGLLQRGVVAPGYRVPVLVSRSDLTGADHKLAYRYEPGNTIRFSVGGTPHAPHWLTPPAAFRKGEYVTVISHDETSNTITVRRANGQLVAYNPARLSGVTVYQHETRAFGVGDRIQTTHKCSDLKLANRQLGTVITIRGSAITVRFDPVPGQQARDVTLPLATFPHLDHGYTMTSYSSQSQTVQHVLYVVDSERASILIVNRRGTYVAISRGRASAELVADTPERLTWLLSRDESNRAAVELVQPGRTQAMSVQQALGHGA